MCTSSVLALGASCKHALVKMARTSNENAINVRRVRFRKALRPRSERLVATNGIDDTHREIWYEPHWVASQMNLWNGRMRSLGYRSSRIEDGP
jgi:hypothetical protein